MLATWGGEVVVAAGFSRPCNPQPILTTRETIKGHTHTKMVHSGSVTLKELNNVSYFAIIKVINTEKEKQIMR